MLGWTHISSNVAEMSFVIHCTQSTSAADPGFVRIAEINPMSGNTLDYDSVNVDFGSSDFESGSTDADFSAEEGLKSVYAYSLTGLQAHAIYRCSIAARNIFGTGPASEAVHVMTSKYGIDPYPHH